MDNKKLLGKRIKELRKSKGLTQEDLAESVGIDSKHLSRIECGVNFPSLDLLGKIAGVLNVETALLFETRHLYDKQVLIKKIRDILCCATEEDVRIFYKILVDLTLSK